MIPLTRLLFNYSRDNLSRDEKIKCLTSLFFSLTLGLDALSDCIGLVKYITPETASSKVVGLVPLVVQSCMGVISLFHHDDSLVMRKIDQATKSKEELEFEALRKAHYIYPGLRAS